ncbi:DNA-directed RNA polymerase subunit omega [bioreactor metagenome]|uniref:DNA-directed RNA polymerase n=1 Tax=bioreactor metagenome TaxID=1076179 RepID=A0A645JPH8_9ZZZZ|nr:DNA-directed RNA polymerase subunit omega [Oscillospiraceae bacterium]
MMLYPAMNKLNDEVPNRYLLVNIVSRRARQLSDTADDMGEKLREKSVTMAINEVAMGEHHVDRKDLYEALNSAEKKGK